MPDNTTPIAEAAGQDRRALKRSQQDSFSSNDTTILGKDDTYVYTSPPKKPKHYSSLNFASQSRKPKNPNLAINVDLANFEFASENRLVRPTNARGFLHDENSILDEDGDTMMDVQSSLEHTTLDRTTSDRPSYDAKSQEIFLMSKAPSNGVSNFPIAELGSEGLLTMGHDFRSFTLLQFKDCPHLIELVAQRARNYAEDNVSDSAMLKFDRVWRAVWVLNVTRERMINLDKLPQSLYRRLIEDSLQEFRDTTKLPRARKYI